MTDKRPFVLFIDGGNAIDEDSVRTLRTLMARFGLGFEELSVMDAKAEEKLKDVIRERRDEIFCFMSSNVWALNVRNGDRLLHTLTGIPLVLFLHDHPVYFLPFVSPALDGTLIVAQGEDCADFVCKYYAVEAATVVNQAGPWQEVPGAWREPNLADFLARKNELLFPMNLTMSDRTIDDVWAVVKALPPARRRRAERMIDVMLTDCFTPLHIASERLVADGEEEIAIEDLQWVLNFVKLWRRLWLVKALIDLPILISSNFVPAELERKHPGKITLLTVPETVARYGKYRFVVNSNPLMTGFLHDRVTYALMNNAICVTDPNALLSRHFADEQNMLFVDYTRSDLAERISRYLDHPELAFDITAKAFPVWTRLTLREDAYRKLLEAVGEMRPAVGSTVKLY